MLAVNTQDEGATQPTHHQIANAIYLAGIACVVDQARQIIPGGGIAVSHLPTTSELKHHLDLCNSYYQDDFIVIGAGVTDTIVLLRQTPDHYPEPFASSMSSYATVLRVHHAPGLADPAYVNVYCARPGAWINYLANLAEQMSEFDRLLEEGALRRESLHFSEINDHQLFSRSV